MDSDDGWFPVMRPYPHIICNAARPDECEREVDGYCEKCHIKGFHADRLADSAGDEHDGT